MHEIGSFGDSLLASLGKRIVFYSVPTSEECKRTREILLLNGADFTEVDVTKSAFAAEQLLKKTGSVSTPAVEVNGVLVKGNDEAALKQALSAFRQARE